MAGVDELDMDSASEFLAMAATLMEIYTYIYSILPARSTIWRRSGDMRRSI